MAIFGEVESFFNVIDRFKHRWPWAKKAPPPKPVLSLPVKPRTNREMVAARLQHVLELMNGGKKQEMFSVAKIARIMGLQKGGDLEQYVRGEREPSFSFLETFAATFGVNSKWLKFGEESPYYSEEKFEHLPEDYFNRIIEMKPQRIAFVREMAAEGDTKILLQLHEWKSVALPRSYHISSHVGGGGKQDIYSFYLLLKKLESAHGNQFVLLGYEIDPSEYRLLLEGKSFPGRFFSEFRKVSHWVDDFTDVDHRLPGAKNYGEWYGREFVEAQSIVRFVREQYTKISL